MTKKKFSEYFQGEKNFLDKRKKIEINKKNIFEMINDRE